MSSCNKAGFTAAVVLGRIDHVAMARRLWAPLAGITVGFVLHQLVDLELESVLPLSVTVLDVQLDCFLEVTWYLDAVFVLGSGAVCVELRLVKHSLHLLFILGNTSKLSPAFGVK